MRPVELRPTGFALPAVMGLCLFAGAGCRGDATAIGASHQKGLIVLGVDGMDPVLTQRYLDEGRLPNVARLIASGTFMPLGTSNPPQSPVAWSSFITGLDSAGHGIFDFVHRDTNGVVPYLSTSRTDAPLTLSLGPIEIPLGAPKMRLLREGPAFWQTLEDHHVPAVVLTIPANFPPAETKFNVSTSGMGTPDLLGTPGTFQVIASGTAAQDHYDAGLVRAARLGQDGIYRAELEGPPGPDGPDSPFVLPVEIAVIPDEGPNITNGPNGADKARAVITLGARDILLSEGQWSDWLPIAFDPDLLGGGLPGMVRLFVKRLVPELFIYASPINLDPLDPAMPLSAPEHAITQLGEAVGRFYTQGMPQNTKALTGGVLSDDEFLLQADLVLQENLRLLDRTLADYRGGLLFFYFSSIDQLSHVFWRAIVPDATPEDARYAHVIPEIYAQIDAAIGRVMAKAGDTPIVIMSDHGFSPYLYKVNLNTWLANQGYLALAEPRSPGPMGHIDWQNTQAYALGLNQLFLNLQGREPGGAVPADQREVVLARLKRSLEAWRDPDTGQRVVTRAEVVTSASFAERAPDLLVGYNRGYRSSDESAMGLVQGAEIERNRSKWSGDHCMDPDHVPGVLISSRKLDLKSATLTDFAPAILEYFGVSPTPGRGFGRGLAGHAHP